MSITGVLDSDHYLPNVLSEAGAIAGHFAQVTKLYQEGAHPKLFWNIATTRTWSTSAAMVG